MIILSVILLSILSGILYRLGGSSPEAKQREFKWLPDFIKYMPKPRDVGCNLCMLVALVIMGIRAPWWTWVIAFGLQWAAISTYWDWAFGYDNHWFHGLMIGVALALPFVGWMTTPLLFGRAVLLGALVGAWAKLGWNPFNCDEEAQADEIGRGVLLCGTLLLFLV